MNPEFEVYANVWQRVLVGIFQWTHTQYLEMRKCYEKHAAEPIFYSGGPLQYVVFAVLPSEAKQGCDAILTNQLVSEIQDAIEPPGSNCMNPDFDWDAAINRVRQHYRAKGWKLNESEKGS